MVFDRTKNSARNIVFGLLRKLITVLFPFITRTLIIYRLGGEYAGISSLFSSILSVLSVTELGIGSAIIFCLYKPVAENKTDIICGVIATFQKIYKIIGCVIFSVGLLCLPFLKYLIKGSYPNDINIYVLFIIYLFNSASSYLLFSYKEVIFSVYQRRDIIDKINISAELLKYIIQIFILLAFPNYYLFVLALLISTIANTLLIGFYSKKYYPNLEPAGRAPKEYIAIIRNKVKYLAANLVSSTLVNSADSLVLSASIGLLTLATYDNYRYISSSVLSIFLIIYVSVTPAVGNVLVTEEKEKIISVFNTLWFGSSWLIIWCSICFACLYQPFITLWVGSKYLLDSKTVIMIIILFFANANCQLFSTIYIHAAGLWNKTVPFRIAASIINLVLDVVLVNKLGVFGVVLATAFAYLCISLPMHLYVTFKYILQENPIVGFKKIGRNILLLIVLGAITFIICSILPVNGILGFILKCIICIILPNAILFFIFRQSKELINLVKYGKNLIIKNK